MTETPSFDELFAACERSAIHLEMRDVYTPADPVFLDWKAGVQIDIVARFRDWYDLIAATVSRGVNVRRARIVSEPISDFVRHEYESTAALNVAAGESVRWLPRRSASDLALPGNDFWLFDDRLVRFGHFAGDGTYQGQELDYRPAVIKLCGDAFEAVWALAIDHERYVPGGSAVQ